MDTSYTKINLPSVLKTLEGENTATPNLFVNPSGALESFFTYKGTIIELHKHKMRIQLGKSSVKEVGDEIRGILVAGIQKGYWIVFVTGSGASFDIAEFFKQFDFNKGDKNFFDVTKLFDKTYLQSSGILLKDEDKDHFGNPGGYTVHSDSRVVYLSGCEETDITELKSSNKNIQFNYIFVQ